MAINTENTYTGNGNKTEYAITFEYQRSSDIEAALDDKPTTKFTLKNSTTVKFNTAPEDGVAIRIFRRTSTETLPHVFSPGSSVKAKDLNQDFEQILFVAQETQRDSNYAYESVEVAAEALDKAEEANQTANQALSKATNAEVTADSAASQAATAVSTANAANSNADAANAAATQAQTSAQLASDSAVTAEAAANIASGAASTAVVQATAAATDASTAVSTANSAKNTADTAKNTADTAKSTADTADANADTAITDSAQALATANAASAAVSDVTLYELFPNVAAIPTSPTVDERIEITDSTGIESFSPLSNVPPGFVGDPGKGARIAWNNSGSWEWVGYVVIDPDDRYVEKTGDTMSGALTVSSGTANGINVAGVFTGGTAGGAGSIDTDEVQIRLSTNKSASDIRGAWISALNTTGASQGHDLLFYTNPRSSTPVERMRIDSSGNLGIGAVNPQEKLDVNGSIRLNQSLTSTTNSIRFGTDGSQAAWLQYQNTATNTSGVIDIKSTDTYGLLSTRDGRPLILNGTGNGKVGIGIDDPLSVLHLKASTPRITFQPTDDTQEGRLTFINSVGTSKGSIVYKYATNSLVFNVNGQLAEATITGSGDFGIGVSDPSEKLEVNGNVKATGVVFGTDDDCEIFSNGSHVYLDLKSGIGNFYIRDGTTTRFTFDDAGTLTASNGFVGDLTGNASTCTTATKVAIAQQSSTRPILMGSNNNNTESSKSVQVPSSSNFPTINGSTGIINANGGIKTTSIFADNNTTNIVLNNNVNIGGSKSATAFKVNGEGYVNLGDSVYKNTSSNAANMNIASNGTLRRESSSLRYKTNVETVEDSYADNFVDNARPVYYEADPTADDVAIDPGTEGWSYWGFIAEELDAIDPRLVSYDSQGRPDGVQYNRVPVLLTNIVRRQKGQIADLTARLEALENKQ